MIIICATGTVATVSRELDWLVNPMLRVDQQNLPIAWAQMEREFRSVYPDGDLRYIEAPLYGNFAAIGLMYNDEKLMRRVFFDPYNGEVIGDLPWYASIQRFMRDLHRFLLIPFNVALYFVSGFGFLLLVSLITGLVVYRKWWRGFFRVRIDKGKRILFGDVHRLMGVWSIWFLIVIGVTGAWYFVERAGNDLNRAFVFSNGKMDAEASSDLPRNFIGLSRALELAKSEIPDLEVKLVIFPNAGKGPVTPFRIEGQVDTIMVRHRANQVLVNPLNGRVIEVWDSRTSPLSKRLFETADPLHFGDFGGMASKLVYFFFGFLTVAMSITGLWMWQRRNTRLQNKGLPYATMGVMRFVSIGIVTIALISGMIAIYIVTFRGV